MDPDNSPPFLVTVLRVLAFVCGFVAVLLVLGAFGSVSEKATANFMQALVCVGSGIGLLWMAKVLELLHEIATKKSTPPEVTVSAPAPAPEAVTEA